MVSSSTSFSSKAFGRDSDPRLIIAYGAYLASRHRLDATLDSSSGCALLTGPQGSGKSTLIREHAAWIDREVPVAVLNGSGTSPRQLVDGMLAQFGVKHEGLGDEQILSLLSRFLGDMSRSKHVPILYLDNFDRSSNSTRTLLNWLVALEVQGKPSLRFVLTGNANLPQLLRANSLRGIARRRPATWAMNPLDVQETAMYLRTKWIAADGDDKFETVFSRNTCNRLHTESNGWPGALDALALEEARNIDQLRATTPRVVLTREGKTLGQHSLLPGNYVIGRSKHSDIQVNDQFVSNNHALLQVYRNAILLVDLNSTNGTTVNSIQVQTKILRSDDVIMLGHHRLKVEHAPPYSSEVEQQIDIAETQTLQHLNDIRRARARHTIAALKHK